MADLIIFPYLDRFEVIDSRIKNLDPNSVCEFSSDDNCSGCSNLIAYLTRMRQLPFIVESRESSRIHSIYAETMRRDKPDLEIL